jgi:eukaryotic-like serine/threonine-protein kinase
VARNFAGLPWFGGIMDESKSRPSPRDPSHDPNAPGLRTPTRGDSSSDNLLGSDGATLADPQSPADPDATLIDLDATYVEGMPIPAVHPKRGTRSRGLAASAAVLNVGELFGDRYEILQLLGEGGMGAVYKARDRELDRFVALKVIRPELASSSAILARFKQELLLAHQVTHRNVIRIYDLSEADGIKFITMEFIEGVDLRKLLFAHGKFSPAETVQMIRQICQALEAAHSVGVIHRDLKPQNIMQDKHGRLLVMDFGLARSVESEGMTQTGALVGTMEYMSPEQAMGTTLDQRSDLFALGLIFFELLTAKAPYKADTALASLLKRSQERAIPAVDIDPNIPRGLSDIVSKCLERDLGQRYQNVQQILRDLDAWEGKRPVSASSALESFKRWLSGPQLKFVAAGAAAVALALSVWIVRGRVTTKTAETPAVHAPVASLAIVPFRNASGDSTLDWLGSSMADMLTTDVGQSASLRTVPPDRVHQILNDLHMAGNATLDAATLRQISESSNSDTLITGQYAKFGDQIRIDASIQDLKHDRRPVPVSIEAASVKDVPAAIDRLADSVRKGLSISTDVAKELQAQSFRPNSQSVEALRAYNEGLNLARGGNNTDALTRFQTAVKEDPDFALAYSKLAQSYSALGRDPEAEQAARKAEDLSANLPARERYLIIANHARLASDNQKAIEYYQQLAKASPEDTEIQLALGGIYDSMGSFDQAREHYNNVLQRDPQSPDALLALGRMLTRSGDPQGGLKYLNTAYNLAVQNSNDRNKAAAQYGMGVAYDFLNKLDEALRSLQDSLTLRRKLGDERGGAASLNYIGVVQGEQGNSKAADKSFQEALNIQNKIGDKRGLGATLLDYGSFLDDHGNHEQALKLYQQSLQIQRDLNNNSMQARVLNNIGSVDYNIGRYEDALIYFQRALELREKAKVPGDIVEVLNNLGETSKSMGQYDQAISQYMRALDLRRNMGDKRGAAIESYGIGTVFEFQGRFGAAVNSKQEALKVFEELKDNTAWMPESQSGYAHALILAGRGDEAGQYLDQALALARELKNNGLIAQVLSFQGDALYYKGDIKSARSFYERALQAANQSKEPDKILISKINLARQDVGEGRSAAGLSALRSLAQEADRQGLKYQALECSIHSAQAMLQMKNFAQARQELERDIAQTERLGLNPLSAQAQFFLAGVLRESGSTSDAQDHYRQALRLIDAMTKDLGADKLLNRSDFSTISTDSKRWLQG